MTETTHEETEQLADDEEWEYEVVQEDPGVLAPLIGWGALAAFAIGFAYWVGAPLLMGERWAGKKQEAIELVKNYKPTGKDTFYDMIRAYSLRAKEHDVYVGEFGWDALQREGPEYEVTLLWTEEGEKHVAVWRVNLEDKSIRPQGNVAASLPQRLLSVPKKEG
ncbi:MAG: hypothetical protein KatS3mg076_0148 [Candidatus Binatia bacterium]|nr:MAG: hypothetical protein KatS3mg076_0148 [Candidatus Binatia bacterium]